jgi:hypothetical protein
LTEQKRHRLLAVALVNLGEKTKGQRCLGWLIELSRESVPTNPVEWILHPIPGKKDSGSMPYRGMVPQQGDSEGVPAQRFNGHNG